MYCASAVDEPPRLHTRPATATQKPIFVARIPVAPFPFTFAVPHRRAMPRTHSSVTIDEPSPSGLGHALAVPSAASNRAPAVWRRRLYQERSTPQQPPWPSYDGRGPPFPSLRDHLVDDPRVALVLGDDLVPDPQDHASDHFF